MKYASVLLAVSCLLSAVQAQPFASCHNSINNEAFPPQNLNHGSLAALSCPPVPPAMPIDSVWLDSLFGPQDTLDTTCHQCGVAVCCSGAPVFVDGYWILTDPHGVRIYSKRFSCEVMPGESVIEASMLFTIVDTGLWTIKCTIPTDSVVWRFRGRQRPGIEEGQPQASSQKLPPTVLHRLPPGAIAFDAMGRHVLNPKSGVYFVREEPSADSRRPSAVVKVVNTR